jgi:threonine synthase
MKHYVSHLEGAIDGARLDPDVLQTLHRDRPIWVRYDLDALKREASREIWAARPPTMWRYRELLPLPPAYEPVTLGETISPLLSCDLLARQCGIDQLWVKDESRLPTGSFKSRGMTMAISMARRFGVRKVALPTAGNAGGAAAFYAARAGMQAYVFMPQDTPVVNQYECHLAGAKTYLVDGLINDCGRIVREGKEPLGWFDLSTLKEPYRIEGKKTMGLELAEQFFWKLPDVIVYPTGGGTGLIGMWKAFRELAELGWLDSSTMPRMVSVQSDGCAPIVRAFEKGERFAEPFTNATTMASGIRVPVAVGDFMILDAVRDSGGCAVAVPEAEIGSWMREATAASGLAICPEAAACVGAIKQLAANGWIARDERVVLFNTGAVQKYVEAMRCDLPRLERGQQPDWQRL